MAALHGNIKKAHPLQVHLQNTHLCTDASGNPRCIHSRRATTNDHHPPRNDSRNTTQQHATATIVFGQIVGADNGGHPASDLTHWLEQGQAFVDLNGLVGDRRAAGG